MIFRSRDVAWQREVHGAHPRRHADVERPAHLAGRVEAVNGECELGDRPVERVQIEILVRRDSAVAARERRRNRDERRSIEERVGDAKRHVDRARPKRRHADAGTTLDLAGDVCHERRGRFMTREQEFDSHASSGFDQVKDFAAGQAKDPRDAGVAQRAG